MNSEIIYKNIWRSAMVRYLLSGKDECTVARIFINVGNNKLLFETLDGNRILFLKDELYSKLIEDGFTIKEFNYEDDSTAAIFFIINKSVIKEKLDKEKVKKKGLK